MSKIVSAKLWDSLREDSALRWLTEYLKKQIDPELELQIEDNDFRITHKYRSVLIRSSSRETFDIEKLKHYGTGGMFGFATDHSGKNASDGYEQVVAVDALSLIFFCLSRYEELGRSSSELDEHGRFSAKSSHAFRHGYLHIPIVDLWVNELAQLLNLDTPIRRYQILLTHDVDRPLKYTFKNFKIALYFLIKRSLKLECKEILLFLQSKILTKYDPYNTFDFIIKNSYQRGLKSWFSFVMNGHHELDPYYKSSNKFLNRLIEKIIKNGHEVGLHGSYDSLSRDTLKSELQQLTAIVGGDQYSTGKLACRMHYLRWNPWTTARQLQKAGLVFDYSCGYADHPGFRCGTCKEFNPYDPLNRETLSIKIIPTILMDVSLWGELYMDLSETDKMLQIARELIDQVKKVNGTFNLLWHNSDLEYHWQKKLYLDILDYAA